MRRILVAFALVLTALTVSGGLAPAPTHAQTANPLTVMVTPNTVPAGATATVTGHGYTPNYYAYVYYQRPDWTYNAFWVQTDYTGSFSFTLGFSPAHGTGTEYVSAYDYGINRWAPFATVTVTAGTPSAAPALKVVPNPAPAGSTATVTGTGFSPNNYVYVSWRRPNGTTNAVYAQTDPSGSFSFQLTFLRSNGCGTETIQAYDYGTGASTAAYPVQVTGC